VPYGYRKAGGGRLRVEPREAEAVRRLFERRVALAHAPRQLARWMDEAAPKPGAARWTANTVRNMLNCRTYLGLVGHGPFVKEQVHEPIVDSQEQGPGGLMGSGRAPQAASGDRPAPRHRLG